MITRKKEIWDNILALSLFWSISQVVLAIFGQYAKTYLHITNTIYVQGSMALAGFGIVLGSILAAKLSRYYINAGIALLGAMGVTLITFLVPHLGSIEIIAPLFLLFGVFSGFILVPLSANIQHLSPNAHLGTILAGNNFIQNIFMILFLMLTTFFAYFGMDAKMLFVLMGFVGVVLFWLLAKRYSVLFVWTLFELLASLRYKVVYKGLENIPQEKAVLLLGNHVSWLDWLFLQIPLRRRINFLMDKEIYHWPLLHPVLKAGEVIPLSPRGFKDAMKEAVRRLQKGHIVAIFPEGEITRNCEINPFHKGFELIDSFEWDGVLVPFYIDGMQGSIFARCKDGRKKPLFRREVHVCFFTPQSKGISALELEQFIKRKRYEC
ncbi:Putative 2-acylglycerophosphoethanolamine acyltransferase / acyl-acyl carrier protein synthetase [hydrothermal vent metagenome]|uniref:Putative 2-acylglycerophosphoethanolamine acyltransferase / acyl-acyl carrier protein synthetase n=1 Tax=hydrothermal vent metagenome TaxID=652676 RepID=A0A1W1BDQ3_9ZZZZ